MYGFATYPMRIPTIRRVKKTPIVVKEAIDEGLNRASRRLRQKEVFKVNYVIIHSETWPEKRSILFRTRVAQKNCCKNKTQFLSFFSLSRLFFISIAALKIYPGFGSYLNLTHSLRLLRRVQRSTFFGKVVLTAKKRTEKHHHRHGWTAISLSLSLSLIGQTPDENVCKFNLPLLITEMEWTRDKLSYVRSEDGKGMSEWEMMRDLISSRPTLSVWRKLFSFWIAGR